MRDDTSIEFFAKLAYMSSLLAPDQEPDMDTALAWHRLPPSERMRLRAIARKELDTLDAAQNNGPRSADPSVNSG